MQIKMLSLLKEYNSWVVSREDILPLPLQLLELLLLHFQLLLALLLIIQPIPLPSLCDRPLTRLLLPLEALPLLLQVSLGLVTSLEQSSAMGLKSVELVGLHFATFGVGAAAVVLDLGAD